jgi:hypothetical protein
MLEAAATSFQIHLKMSAAESARVLSAPMVALAANSPFLFGRELWCETRIPLFEQAVSVGGSPLRERVGFGINYAQRSVLECLPRQHPPLSGAAAAPDGRAHRSSSRTCACTTAPSGAGTGP